MAKDSETECSTGKMKLFHIETSPSKQHFVPTTTQAVVLFFSCAKRIMFASMETEPAHEDRKLRPGELYLILVAKLASKTIDNSQKSYSVWYMDSFQ